ncbi:hypothetical protein Q0M94_28590 (plasmid) [Deinococcus radiomollis]|uniref:hypothetical protein n=1 Tax=Deinococcus radiomollis TaxID=468916 RepID=UPI00389225B3
MAAVKPLPNPRSDDGEKFRRFTRAHSPFRPPRFTVWHAGLFLVLALLFLAQQSTPGLLADVGSLVVGDWQVGVVSRITVILLHSYAMFLVRGIHPLMYVACPITVIGLCLRLGEIRITHEPLTLSFALVLLALAIFAVRVVTRQPDMATRGDA